MTVHLAKKLASRFIKPEVLQEEKVSTDILDNHINYLPFSEVFIGLITKTKLNKLLQGGDITQNQWVTCMKGAVAFYSTSLK